MDTLELALVGAGRMGSIHLRALAASDVVRVVAVTDPDAAARERVVREGLRTHATVEELIEAGGFDAALVASPTGTHLAMVRALADSGIPILCEKPCGRTAVEALEAGRVAAEAGVPLQVGYWRRFVPALRSLRKEILEGSLGAILWVHCFQWDELPPSAAFVASSGGLAVDMGVHELDLGRWLTGEAVLTGVGLSSVVDAPHEKIEGELESLAFTVRLSGGALVSASVGRRFPPGDACRVQVIGTSRTVDLPFVWPPEGERVFLGALREQAERFAAWVGGGEPEGATAEDAVAALAAAELVTPVSAGRVTP